MKKIFLVSVAMMPFIAYAQSGRVGVNTAMPNATLDVTANAADPTIADGVIPPQLTRQQLINKTAYGTSQKGAMVYVTDASGTTNTATANVNSLGYYFFDGSIWQKVAGNDWSLTGNAGTDPSVNFIGTTDDKDIVFRRNSSIAGWIGSAQNGYNTAFGDTALQNTNNAGTQNTALGVGAMYSLKSTSTANTAIGAWSLYYLNSGFGMNTAVGQSSLDTLQQGDGNTAIGQHSSSSLQIGSYNTTVGNSIYLGNGDRNTVMGAQAAYRQGTGSNNIAIGYQATLPSSVGIPSTVIGNSSNELSIGNSIYGLNINDGDATNDLIGVQTKAPGSTFQVGGSIAANIRTASGAITDTDFTVLASGDVTLPAASTANAGRVYHIINDTAGNLNINGTFRVNGGNFTNYGLNTSNGGKAVTVQSTGTAWVVLAGY